MNVVLLRVGIDLGSGGAHSPLFEDGSFEFVPIPGFRCIDNLDRTYGNTPGLYGRKLVEYLPSYRRSKLVDMPLHDDPDFATFTYGDPTRGAKQGLRRLEAGDFLVFYAGLKPWPEDSRPSALYVVGYFIVQRAGLAHCFTDAEIAALFHQNAHVRNTRRFQGERSTLILIRGGPSSRLLSKAALLSEPGTDRAGRPLHVISKNMQKIVGDFDGRIAIQRSSPRWVDPAHADSTAEFVRSLP